MLFTMLIHVNWTWERFPASKNLTSVWKEENFLESSDILLSTKSDGFYNLIANFRITNTSLNVVKLVDALDSKLQNWRDILTLSKSSKPE